VGVAELDKSTVVKRVVCELDAGSGREIRDRTRALHQLWQPGHMIGLHVGLEHGNNRVSDRVGRRQVTVDQIRVRINDS
jgi:hypothetical protein